MILKFAVEKREFNRKGRKEAQGSQSTISYRLRINQNVHRVAGNKSLFQKTLNSRGEKTDRGE